MVINLGKVGLTPRGAWGVSVADYEYLDTVTYQGSTYMVSLKTGLVPVGTLPTNTAYYQLTAEKGGVGWTPIHANVADGIRTVQQLVDYVGGTSTKPTENIGSYVSTTGYTNNIALAKDIQGAQGTSDIAAKDIGANNTVTTPVSEPVALGSSGYLYTNSHVPANTFSGYGFPIGNPKGFNKFTFNVRARTTPITKVVVAINVINKLGAQLATKIINIAIPASTVGEVVILFDSVIANTAGDQLYFMFSADAQCEILGLTSGTVFPSGTYGTATTVNNGTFTVNQSNYANASAQFNGYFKTALQATELIPSTFFSEKVATNSPTIQQAKIESAAAILVANTNGVAVSKLDTLLSSAFINAQTIQNPVESLLESGSTTVTSDSGSLFYGWGSPIGLKNNFNAIMVKVIARLANTTNITTVTMYITQTNRSGTLIATKTVTGLNIAPGATAYVLVHFDVTIENLDNNRLFMAFKANQPIWFFGKTADKTLYPSPEYGSYAYTVSQTDVPPASWSTGFLPADNQRVNWTKIGTYKEVAMPTAEFITQIAAVLPTPVIPESVPLVAMAPRQFIVSGREIALYFENILKDYPSYRGRTSIDFTNGKLNGRAGKLSPSAIGTQSFSLSVSDKQGNNFTGLSAKSFSLIVTDPNKNTALNIINMGDSYTLLSLYTKPLMALSSAGLTFHGIRNGNGVGVTVKCEGRGGSTLANYFTINKSRYFPFYQPQDPYRYYGNTQFWINANTLASDNPEYYYVSDHNVKNQFSSTTGYKLAPNVNDLMYNNATTSFVYWDGSVWVSILETALTWTFNFGKYRSNWGYPAIDVFYAQFGTNDFNGYSETAMTTEWTNWKNRMDIVIASVQADNANTKIAVAIPPSSGRQGLDGNRISETRKLSYWIHANNIIANYAGKEAQKIYIVDFHSAVDRDYAFLNSEEIPYARYTGALREYYKNDNVHLSNDGFNQMGDVYHGLIQSFR